jgi:hypothetical protein
VDGVGPVDRDADCTRRAMQAHFKNGSQGELPTTREGAKPG